MLTERIEKKLDENATNSMEQILEATSNKMAAVRSLTSKTIQIRWTRRAVHCWRSKDELTSNVLLRTPSYRRANVGRQTRTYLQQLCMDTGCSLEDLLKVIVDRDEWRQRVREIRASSTWWYIHIYNWETRKSIRIFHHKSISPVCWNLQMAFENSFSFLLFFGKYSYLTEKCIFVNSNSNSPIWSEWFSFIFLSVRFLSIYW